LGGSAYELRNLDVLMDGNPMVPLSVLGKVRHAMVSQLDASVAMPPQRRISQQSVLADMRSALQTATTLSPDTERNVSLETDAGTSIAGVGSPSPPQLRVLCRTLDQLRTLVQIGVSSVMVDFQDIRQYREAVAVARRHNVEIYLATPRIQKPDEMGIFHVMRRHQADGILVRNLAGLQFFHRKEVPIVADYSLNTANELTALYLREQGARRVTASYDLNREQLLDLVSAVPASWLEVVIHQHMPMFHMEHCVFCAVLSPGTNKTNCGRPCDVHEVRLRDRIGMEHPLKADVGCRNTLYNAVPQSAAEAVPELRARGVCHYRLELLDDPPESLEQLVQLYHDLLAGRTRGNEVWQRLKASNRVGVTRGTLEERRNPLAIL
jgi:putative protease